jgi:RHH-type rel operon transcriptional repressor/antitoxin RelB
MISLYLPKSLASKLNQIAKREGRSRSKIIKELLETYVATYSSAQNAYDLGKKYFGKIATGLTDGSAHHKEIIKSKVAVKCVAAR